MPKKAAGPKRMAIAEAEFAKVLVAVFIDRDVYEWTQKFGDGYSREISRILRAEMERPKSLYHAVSF